MANGVLSAISDNVFVATVYMNEIVQALENNVIKAAGLDVFDGEPKINPILMAAPNLVMLPHLGSATKETREEMGFRALENCKAFFKGDTPMDKVA